MGRLRHVCCVDGVVVGNIKTVVVFYDKHEGGEGAFRYLQLGEQVPFLRSFEGFFVVFG